MKIVVDPEKCLGCGSCVALAGDYFAIDPKTGKSKVIKQPEGNTPEVDDAIASCPFGAITKEETDK